MYRFRVSGLKARRFATGLCTKVFSEYTMFFGKEELKVQSIDPSHVAMVEGRFSIDWFDDYEGDGSKVSFSLEDVDFKLASKGKGGLIQLRGGSENAEVAVSGGDIRKKYTISMFESETDYPEVKVEHLATVAVRRKGFLRVLKEIPGSYSVVKLTVYRGGMKVSSRGEDWTVDADLQVGEGVVVSVEGSEASSCFNVGLLRRLLEVDVEKVIFDIGNDVPLRIDAYLSSDLLEGGFGRFRYWLAPRIVEE